MIDPLDRSLSIVRKKRKEKKKEKKRKEREEKRRRGLSALQPCDAQRRAAAHVAREVEG